MGELQGSQPIKPPESGVPIASALFRRYTQLRDVRRDIGQSDTIETEGIRMGWRRREGECGLQFFVSAESVENIPSILDDLRVAGILDADSTQRMVEQIEEAVNAGAIRDQGMANWQNLSKEQREELGILRKRPLLSETNDAYQWEFTPAWTDRSNNREFPFPPNFQFMVPFNTDQLETQLGIFDPIYRRLQLSQQPANFTNWFTHSLEDTIAAGESAIETDREIDQFTSMVDGALRSNPQFNALASQLCFFPSAIGAMEEMQKEVLGRNQSNLIRVITERELPELYRLVKAIRSKYPNPEGAMIVFPGSNHSVPINAFLDQDFWTNQFYGIVERMIKNGGLRMLHNMNSLDSLDYNISHGIGRASQFRQEASTSDITSPYVGQNETSTVAFSMLAPNHRMYGRGAGQGGSGDIQITLDPQAIASQTIFFPHDTGDPQSELDLNFGSFDMRRNAVLNLVGGAELATIRHMLFSLYNYLKNGNMESSNITSIGNFGFVEGNTFKAIEFTKSNVTRVTLTQKAERENSSKVGEVKKSIEALGIALEEK